MGFKLIDAEIGWRPKDPKGWWIVQVAASLKRPKALTIVMQCGLEGEVATITLDGITSFRLQDEREMVDYWQQMRGEGVPPGTFYTVETSDYLRDLSGGVSAAADKQVHYLIAAEEECVDFLGPGWGGTPMKIEITFNAAGVS